VLNVLSVSGPWLDEWRHSKSVDRNGAVSCDLKPTCYYCDGRVEYDDFPSRRVEASCGWNVTYTSTFYDAQTGGNPTSTTTEVEVTSTVWSKANERRFAIPITVTAGLDNGGEFLPTDTPSSSSVATSTSSGGGVPRMTGAVGGGRVGVMGVVGGAAAAVLMVGV